MMKVRKQAGNPMPESRPPEFGINSWLEDELYQQYLHDRKTVDESWKKVFESNGGGVVSAVNGEAQRPAAASNGSAKIAAPVAGAGLALTGTASSDQLIP